MNFIPPPIVIQPVHFSTPTHYSHLLLKYGNIHSKDGYKFIQTNDISSLLGFRDEESVRTKFFYPYLKKGLKFLDIGCAGGTYTLPALAKGCVVTGIDLPIEAHVDLYKANVKINNFEVDFIPIALYSKKGWINQWTKHFASTKEEEQPPLPEGKQIPFTPHVVDDGLYYRCDRLDSVYKKKVDFIKIDVEGFELDVLKGGEKTIKKNRSILLVENHDFIDAGMRDKVIDLIDSWDLGYKHEWEKYHAVSHTLFTSAK